MLSVLALPFHLMITYSGLLFFAFLYLPGILLATYGSGEEGHEQFEQEMLARSAQPERAGEAAPLAPLAPMLERAGAIWSADQIYFARIDFPGGCQCARQLLPYAGLGHFARPEAAGV